jgi:hypothetical protein
MQRFKVLAICARLIGRAALVGKGRQSRPEVHKKGSRPVSARGPKVTRRSGN